MLELLVKASVLLLLALTVSALLPRTWPTQRHGVLLAALLVLPLLPLFSLLPTELSLRYPEVSSSTTPPLVGTTELPLPATEFSSDSPPLLSKPRPLSFVLPGVWLAGMLVLLLRQLADQRALARLLKTATRSPLPVDASFPILLTAQPTVPLACGIRRPRILLPESACAWESERLQAVLLHETAHLRRRDPLWQCVTELIRAVFWFHPLVWLAVFRLRQEAESACDRHVLASGIAPDRYAHYLLEIVKMLKNRPSAPAMAHTPRLEGRVRSILSYLPTRPKRSAMLTLALMSVATVPLLAARPQSEAPAQQAPPAVHDEKHPDKHVAQDQEKMRLDQAKAAAEKKATKLALSSTKAKPAEEKALVEKQLRERLALVQRQKDLDLQLNKLRKEEDIARARERHTRDLTTEPLDEDLEELKLKFRNLDSRMTDKQLELAELSVSFGPTHPRVKVVQNQMDVLTKMMGEVRQQREHIRAKLQETMLVQRAEQQKLQIDEQEKVLVELRAELEAQELVVQQISKQVQTGAVGVDALTNEQAKFKQIKALYQMAESRLKQIKG